MHPVRAFFHEFEWIHIALGLIGNLSFAVGSVLFLWEATRPFGTWLFIVGSIGMLIGSIGTAVVKLWRVDGRVDPPS